jgi:hypothetical protein
MVWIPEAKTWTGVHDLDFPEILLPSVDESSSVDSPQSSKARLRTDKGQLIKKAELILYTAEAAGTITQENRVVYERLVGEIEEINGQLAA